MNKTVNLASSPLSHHIFTVTNS